MKQNYDLKLKNLFNFLDHFPKIESMFSKEEQRELYRNQNLSENEKAQEAIQKIEVALKAENYKPTYLVTGSRCEMSNEMQLDSDLVRPTDSIKHLIDRYWCTYKFVFDFEMKRSPNDFQLLMHSPLQQVVEQYLEFRDTMEYSTDKIEQAQDRETFERAFAALSTYIKDLRCLENNYENVPIFSNILNEMKSRYENLDQMFLFKKDNWINQEELDFIKKYNLYIELNVYVPKYNFSRKSKIVYKGKGDEFFIKHNDSNGIVNLRQSYDDIKDDVLNQINTFITESNDDIILSIDVRADI